MVALSYLSNFWRTLAMSQSNCEVNLSLSWYTKCIRFYDVLAA